MAIPDNISINLLGTTQLRRLSALFDTVWPELAPFDEMVDWSLFRCPLGRMSTVGAIDKANTAIIGARPAMRWPIVTNDGRRVQILQFGGTCVHPSYRRIGLFRAMNDLFLRTAIEQGEMAIFNVSVVASRRGYEKQGWKYLPGLRRYILIPSLLRFLVKFVRSGARIRGSYTELPTGDGQIDHGSPAHGFSALALLREKQFAGLNHSSYRSARFMRWRYDRKDRSYGALTSQGEYWCAYKVVRRRNFREVVIGDVWLDYVSRDAVRNMIAHLCARERPDIVSVCMTRSHPYRNVLMLSGFIPDPKGDLNLGVRTLTESARALNDADSWALMTADIDTF